MEYTTNKNLAKPTENETYDLATVNENMDKIDTALKANDDAISSLTEKMIQRKVYSNITTDQFGFFSISKLSTDFPKGFNIISATGKNAAVGSDGTNVLPVFSISKNEVQCNYGYLYKMSGGNPTPLANATNVTVLVLVVG